MSVILKLNKGANLLTSNEGIRINSIFSNVAPLEFVKLLKVADNKVNPRTAKKNPITKSIHETLDVSPELFWLKSKGLLVATESCETLERNRIRLTLDNADFEGVMDGGHNTFAIASWLVEKLFNKKLKDWDETKQYWEDHYDEILDEFRARTDEFKFSIPIEIIFPDGTDGSLDEYYDYISEICSARNNNVQLRETAKGNKVGFYDHLKEKLNNDFEIIWRTGEKGKIRSEDVISLSSLPLVFLQKEGKLPQEINPLSKISIYSQKSKCVDFFNSVMSNKELSCEDKGKHILESEIVKSALDLSKDILFFFDKMFLKFPELYHHAAPGKFGRISSVIHNKPTRVPFHTTEEKSNYQYSYGFFYPLICGLTELIELDDQGNSVRWKINPKNLDLNRMDLSQYVELVKMVSYDPQKIGKGNAFYNEAESVFKKLS